MAEKAKPHSIKTVRFHAGQLTQLEFANLLGFSQVKVCFLEKGAVGDLGKGSAALRLHKLGVSIEDAQAVMDNRADQETVWRVCKAIRPLVNR